MTRRRWLVLALLLVAVWGLAVAIGVWQGAGDLQAARGSLTRAAQELGDSDLSAARDHLGRGHDSAAQAAVGLGRPWVAPLRLLPVVGDNLDAATVLAVAARDLSDAGGDVLDVASEIVHGEQVGVPRGQLPLDHLERIAPSLAALQATMEDAVGRVDALACADLLHPVARACQRFVEITEPAVAQVRTGAEMARVAPDMLGRDGPRRYLVFAASYSELRGSMGLLGSWALMTADDGRLDVGPFRETAELAVPARRVTGPSEAFITRYERYGVLRDWRNVNMSPSFPDAAQVLLDLWDAGGGVPVDGVLVTSPLVVEGMIGELGPLDVPGVTTLTSANARSFIGLDAYAAFDTHAERKRVLGAVATAGFERMLDVVENSDVMGSAEMLQGLVARGDLLMYARDPEVQHVLEQVGMAGELPSGDGEFASVVVNNVAGNKLDFFATRQLHHRVRVLPGGVTTAEVEFVLGNDAPTTGYPRYVLGPATSLADAGDNLSLVSLYCGRTCTLTGRPGGARDGGREGGLPVWDLVLRVPSGDQRRVAYRTQTEGGWYRDGAQIVVPVHHVVQPALHDASLHVGVEIPEGWVPVDLPDGAEVSGDAVVLRDSVSHEVRLEVRFEPAPTRQAADGAEDGRR